MIRIGYQGEVGSNNEAAAAVFVKEMNFGESDYELVPLVESKYVASYLKSGKIDYGVVATRNSVAGTVSETYEAIKDEYFEFVQTVILPIHHCVFIKEGVDPKKIKVVTSHVQALKQTSENRRNLFPDWEEKITNDTASAARNLSLGVFPDDYAVICRKNAGEKYGLKLYRENIEDVRNNRTEFRVFKKSSMDYSEKNKPTLREILLYQFASEDGMGYIAKGIMIIGMLIAIFIAQYFKMEPLDTAMAVGGYTTTIILFLRRLHSERQEGINYSRDIGSITQCQIKILMETNKNLLHHE